MSDDESVPARDNDSAAPEGRSLRARLARLSPIVPHARAAFVAFHLIAIAIAALPAPTEAMNRASWKAATVRTELDGWSKRLGVPVQTLEERLWSAASAWLATRKALVAPFAPYLKATGCTQAWRMFVAPHRFPERFRIEARERDAEEWTTLFEERSDEHQWRRRFFDHDRIRGILFLHTWPQHAAAGRRTCEWLARRVFEEQESAEEVRCRYYKARSPSAAEVMAGKEPDGTWEHEHVVRRDGQAKKPSKPKKGRKKKP